MGRGRAQEPKRPPPSSETRPEYPCFDPWALPSLVCLSSNQRIAKGAGGKGPRQKTSKSVKKCQTVFRHFSTTFAQGKKRQNRQKASKSFSTLFDNFRAALFFRPLLGGSDQRPLKKKETPKGRSPVPLQLHPCNFRLHPSNLRLHPSNFQLHPDYTYTF